MHDKLKTDIPEIYYGRTYGTDLRYYIGNETQHYNDINNCIPEILKIDYKDLFEEYTDTLNPEKTSLFIANLYLHRLKEAVVRKDVLAAQECIFYLRAYLRLKINVDKEISFYYEEPISNKIITREINNALKELPELRVLDYDRSFFENKPLEDNKKVIETLLKIESLKTDEIFIKNGKKYIRSAGLGLKKKREKASPEELEQIAKLLAEKEYVYLKNEPIAQIECDKRFSNYRAFVYENGMVPADRFKGIYHLDLAKQDAVYVFDAENFEEMIKLDKQDLRGKVPRFYHSSKWKDKVDDVVSKETPEELHEAALPHARKKEDE